MIFAEVKFLQIPGDVKRIMIDRVFLTHSTDEKYYLDFLQKMPYYGIMTTNDYGNTIYNITALKMIPKIDNDFNEYVKLERTSNCYDYTLKSQTLRKKPLTSVQGLPSDDVIIKVKSHDKENTELCEWVESKKEPDALLIKWATNNYGIEGDFISYYTMYGNNENTFILLLPYQHTIILKFTEKVRINIKRGKIEYRF